MLNKIIDHKRKEIMSLNEIKKERIKPVLDFRQAVEDKKFIFEIKKASPSKGAINLNVDICRQGLMYEQSGAGCISVLTDSKFFSGSYNDLAEVASSVKIPVLCKDFILSGVQIENAYRSGADAILLIAPVLSNTELDTLSEKANSLGLSILYEIHELFDLKRITKFKPQLVGVNARNFNTLTIEHNRSGSIISQLKGSFLKIAESGITSSDDIKFYLKHGADAFLIGSSIMSSPEPENTVQSFRNTIRESLCL